MKAPKKMMMQQGAGVMPWYISLPGSGTSKIDAGNHASVAKLQDAAFTVEFWTKMQLVQPDTTVTYMDKGFFSAVGWLVYSTATGAIFSLVKCATTDASSSSLNTFRDFLWHHITVCFDDAGDRKIYIAVDGAWQAYGAPQTAGNGAIVDDTAQKLIVGSRGDSPAWRYYGYFGWIRISNNIRYTVGVNFSPPGRAYPPANDANTVRLFWVDEGTGTTLTDKSTNAQNASIDTGTWGKG